MQNHEPHSISDLEFRNIKITDNLRDVAQLIYQTDNYIYPALFGSCENAEMLLPGIITQNTSCFCENNLFGAVYTDHVTGIICYFNSDYKWDSEVFLNEFKRNRIEIPQTLCSASENYFEGLLHSEDLKHGTYIMSMCVRSDLRNIGLGERLLRCFFERKGVKVCSLVVLEENTAAISLYKKLGFVIKNERAGFSAIPPYPKCCYMVRSCS